MRWNVALVGVFACAGLASCGEEGPPTAGPARGGTLQGAVTQSPPAAAAAAASAPAPARLPVSIKPQAEPAARQSDALPPPKDAEWTLFCRTFSGPSHIQQAKSAKAQLLSGTPMKEWYLVHGDEETSLYYGYYRSINGGKDAAESTRAQKDKRTIEAMKDTAGQRLFPTSLFVELSAPDPVAPPEWDLANVARRYAIDDPNRPFWSLQVGAYKDHPDRKRYAVEAVQQARAMGEEAYFFHGETVSSVCIGAWPYSVVAGDSSEARTNDQNQPIMVIDGNLPRPKGEVRDSTGQKVQTFSTQLTVVDEKALAKMRQYPSHLTNGEETVYRSAGKESRQRSFLVQIPHPGDAQQVDQASLAHQQQTPRADDRPADPWGMTRQGSAEPRAAQARPAGNQPPPATGGGGRLRSLDGR